MKLLVRLVIVVLILLVAGVGALFFYVDAIAKKAIERGGTYALGVETTLDSADVGILSGTFSMKGLNVANPEGFDSPHFLHLNEGGVDVTLGSLREEVVELPLLAFGGIDVYLQKQGAETNYKVILDNLKRLETGEKAPSEDTDGKRYIIRKIEVTDVNVHVELLPIGGDVTKLNVPIDRIELTDVGSESNRGVLMSELSSIVIKAVLAAVVEKGGSLLPTDLLGDLSGQLAGLESLQEMGVGMVADVQAKVTGGIDKVTQDVAEEAQDAIDKVTGDVANKVNEGLKGILGGDKKDE